MNIPEQLKVLAEGSKWRNLILEKSRFYCDKVCFVDSKHPDRNPFEMVATKDTGIYRNTLELCKFREDDTKSNSIERRLLRYLCFCCYHSKALSRFVNICKWLRVFKPKPRNEIIYISYCLNSHNEVYSFYSGSKKWLSENTDKYETSWLN